ncbi:uncharacterized protein LOC132695583 isoform X2 [Cylas formicarius]|uniref:uncharacterized protein LOC132695583 isoform X2 n=1 Tax=Cylas formicarius TaxID=197179 RepID=UPI0029587898|nr:uncharacterized protein LOC132695583 isoform X2 [Cylas formicarius]
MPRFDENNCRLCRKVFCCVRCRKKHEKAVHDVNPDCEICVYGCLILKNKDQSIIEHLKSKHWPLYCIYCKEVFNLTEELLQHNICPASQYSENSPKTPFTKALAGILISTHDQDSPIFSEQQRKDDTNYVSKVVTSTPVEKCEYAANNKTFKKDTTPCVENKSIIKKPDSENRSAQISKRRVTFSETPIDLNHNTKLPANKNTPQKNLLSSSPQVTPFYTAKSEMSVRNENRIKRELQCLENTPVLESEYMRKVFKNDPEEQENGEKENTGIPTSLTHEDTEVMAKALRGDDKECNTLWLSAINLSDTENKPLNIVDSPPGSTTNILRPTPIIKRSNFHVKLQFPVHLSSTPISSNLLKESNILKAEIVGQNTEIFVHNVEGVTTEHMQNTKTLIMQKPIQLTAGPSKNEKLDCQKEYSTSQVLERPDNKLKTNGFLESSSMTETTLWSSVTKIVKKIMQGITSNSDPNICDKLSNSFKRNHSDSDDSYELHQYKRQKLIDIKCRRPIRELSELYVPHRLPIAGPTTSIEVVRSVNTIHHQAKVKTYVDKSTQTDDYLLFD